MEAEWVPLAFCWWWWLC